MFRTCLANATMGRPFSDYTWMCTLDVAKGLQLGKTYLNDKAARTFTGFIAEVEKEKLASVTYCFIL